MGSPAWRARWKETEFRPCKGRLPRPTTNERGFWNDMGSTWWKQWLEAELSALRGSFAQNPVSEREAGSGTTWGALTRIPHLGALRGPLTQNPNLGAGVGPGTTRGALRGGCLGKKRSYDLTRVVYPDPPSRSEKRDLERHEERGVEDAMEAAEIRPYEGCSVHLGARRGSRTTCVERCI